MAWPPGVAVSLTDLHSTGQPASPAHRRSIGHPATIGLPRVRPHVRQDVPLPAYGDALVLILNEVLGYLP